MVTFFVCPSTEVSDPFNDSVKNMLAPLKEVRGQHLPRWGSMRFLGALHAALELSGV